MRPYRPQRLCVERSVRDSLITRNVLDKLAGIPVEEIETADSLVEASKLWSPSIAGGKRVLVLSRHRGRFFKPCPAGTTRQGLSNVCCNYFVINYASNCHMECSYCYLQSHLNLPYMVVYANCGDLLSELEQVFLTDRKALYRVGTGELADSLALDPLTGYSRPLVEFFARQPNAVLEFKTKSDCVEGLLDLEHRGRTVVSWSLNPEAVVRGEEFKTAGYEQRLRAAARCAAAGYPIVFHFDPIIHYAGWQRDYREMVEDVFDRLPKGSVPWVSLGALRMTFRLKEIMRGRFPSSRLPLGELVPTADGKLRYFKPIRVDMLSKMRQWILRASPKTQVYTCMENAEVWGRVFPGRIPTETEIGDSLLQILR